MLGEFISSPAAIQWTMPKTVLPVRWQTHRKSRRQLSIAARTGFVRGEAVLRRLQRSLRALKWKEAIVEWRLIPLLFLPLLTDFRSLRARGYHSTGTAGAV